MKASAVAFVHGFAEATVFFIVPDVSLSVLACRRLSVALRAAGWAVAGAAIGGGLMCLYGRLAPERARALLEAVPGIGPSVLASVRAQLGAEGLAALWRGGFSGLPYKTYAVEWGAGGGAVVPLVLWTIPSRGIRFLVSALVTSGAARLVGVRTGHRAGVAYALLACFWVGLYVVYFARVGW